MQNTSRIECAIACLHAHARGEIVTYHRHFPAAYFAAAMERLRTLTRHLGAAHAASYEHNNDPYTQPVEEALRRLPGGDGPGDPGIPEALDPDAPMSVFLLMGQSSMAGRGMLPEFQTPIPDILSFHYEYDEWDVAVEPL